MSGRPFESSIKRESLGNEEARVGYWRRRFPRLASLRVLLNQGCEVLCVDNFFTGARGNVDELLTIANSRSCAMT